MMSMGAVARRNIPPEVVGSNSTSTVAGAAEEFFVLGGNDGKCGLYSSWRLIT